MGVYNSTSVNFEYVKVRWTEPYVSHGLNRKLFGILPKGVYAGFVIGPGGLNNRDIIVTTGSVSGGLGSGMVGGYVSGNFDESVGWMVAVHQNTAGHQTTVTLPPGAGPLHLDATGQEGTRRYIAIDVSYSISAQTTASLRLVDAAELNSNPTQIVVGYVDVPASPSTPLDASMFGYNDTSYPRLTPLATSTKAGFMPASVFAQLQNPHLPWETLLLPERDPNNNYIIQISPSQNVINNRRIYAYTQSSLNSKFPRDGAGLYNGGVANDQLTKLNLLTGVISGAHQVTGNTTFSTPSIVGTPNRFQVGIIGIDINDHIVVTYGASYTTLAAALLDDNMPVLASQLQICAFVATTDGAGSLNALTSTGILDRRMFLNLGGGGETFNPNTILTSVSGQVLVNSSGNVLISG